MSITKQSLRTAASALLSLAPDVLSTREEVTKFEMSLAAIVEHLLPNCVVDDSHGAGRDANIELLSMVLDKSLMRNMRAGFVAQLARLRKEQLLDMPDLPASSTPSTGGGHSGCMGV